MRRPPPHCLQPGDCVAFTLTCLCDIPASDATVGPSSPAAAAVWQQLADMQAAGVITASERAAIARLITGPGGTVRAGLFTRLAAARLRAALARQRRTP